MLAPMFEDCESCETCDIKQDCDEIRKYCLSEKTQEEGKQFEIGKFYKHIDGTIYAVVGEAITMAWGKCLIIEDESGSLRPFGYNGSEEFHEVTKEEALDLCSYCKEEFAECNGDPKFDIGKGNDNVYECKQFN